MVDHRNHDVAEGVEMEVRVRHTVANEDSNAGEDSIPGQGVQMSASVRRLLSNENFHAPKQEGTVRTSARVAKSGLFDICSGLELEDFVPTCGCRERRRTG